MSTDFSHRKEEYISLRKEIDSMLLELSTLERSCVLAIAAVYVWLASNTEGLSPFHSAIAWGAPFFVAFFGALRAHSINEHFGIIASYIKTVEGLTTSTDQTFLGWEHYFADQGRSVSQTKTRIWFWGILIGVTFVTWVVSRCHG